MSAILGIYFIFMGLALIVLVFQIIANWRIFTKAGEAGWKSIIPFYSSYILYKITWTTVMFWISIGLSIIASILITRVDSAIFIIAGRTLAMAAVMINVIDFHKLSKAFGHGIGFTLGLIFFNPIFMLILGFGSSEYKGIQD